MLRFFAISCLFSHRLRNQPSHSILRSSPTQVAHVALRLGVVGEWGVWVGGVLVGAAVAAAALAAVYQIHNARPSLRADALQREPILSQQQQSVSERCYWRRRCPEGPCRPTGAGVLLCAGHNATEQLHSVAPSPTLALLCSRLVSVSRRLYGSLDFLSAAEAFLLGLVSLELGGFEVFDQDHLGFRQHCNDRCRNPKESSCLVSLCWRHLE